MIIPFRGKHKSKIKGYSISENRVFIYMPDHPHCKTNNYIALARLVVEHKIGRYLNSDEIVHHVNGNTMDDKIENLKLLSVKEHSQIHYSSSKMIEGRRKKYLSGWNPNLKGKNNPNWKGGKTSVKCKNKNCNNNWLVWPSLVGHKLYCSKLCRISY